jgi:hypothetical protein
MVAQSVIATSFKLEDCMRRYAPLIEGKPERVDLPLQRKTIGKLKKGNITLNHVCMFNLEDIKS